MRSVKIRTEKSRSPLTSNSGCTPDIFPLAWPSNYQYMFALPKTGVAGKNQTRLVHLMAKPKTQKKETDSANGQVNSRRSQKAPVTSSNSSGNDENLSPFLRKQKGKLLQLRDSLLDSMMDVSR